LVELGGIELGLNSIGGDTGVGIGSVGVCLGSPGSVEYSAIIFSFFNNL